MTDPRNRRPEVLAYFRSLQDAICASLTELDPKGFHEDSWDRDGGGGGRSRVITEGELFEKAGVNFSDVFGTLSPEFASHLPGSGLEFTAAGVSLVLHPRNPMIPTVHANFRFLTKGDRWWFGGGADLTPYYPFREDVIHFHRTWKAVCSRHPSPVDYPKFKTWCDDYFFIKHRNEHRGVGGIFFDYLEGDFDTIFRFVQDAANSFVDAYTPIARRRRVEPFEDSQRKFQEFRRGRYAEFNLVYDRGTIFGLKTGGRIESILMSLPPVVRWIYDYHPVPGSREAELYETLRPRDWAEET